MGARKVAQFLDSAEGDLCGVTRSMLAADPAGLRQSQALLERLVENLNGVKDAARVSGYAWPPAIRVRLQNLHRKLQTLEMLGEAALRTVAPRNEGRELSTRGYTAHGTESGRIVAASVTVEG